MSTLIEDSLYESTLNDTEEKVDINSTDIIFDLNVNSKYRIEALHVYLVKNGESELLEVINRLVTMFELSGTSLIKQYLYDIAQSSLPLTIRIICLTSLHFYNEKDEVVYDFVNNLLNFLSVTNDNSISTLHKVELIKILSKSLKYSKEVIVYMSPIINNPSLDTNFRMKVLFQMENVKDVFSSLLKSYIFEDKNMIKSRILCSQTFLKKNDIDKDIIDFLLKVSKDTTLEENTRADSLDILLGVNDEEIKKEAFNMIRKLGKGNNFYENSQNVHSIEVEKSVSEAIEFLQGVETLKIKGKDICYEDVEKDILECVKNIPSFNNNEILEKVELCFNRISFDRATYSNLNFTLKSILVKIWSYIENHVSKEEIKKRLIEELIDMVGTCSSGFASRLVNSISGFGDFSIRISWGDQISGNFTAKLNNLIQNLDDLSLQEKILDQMSIDPKEFNKRLDFLHFLRDNISSIRLDLYEDFKNHVDDTSFDLYFKQSVIKYETGDNY